MSTTLPAYRYRDPAEVAERDELRDLRVIDGCISCRNHQPVTWRCRINHTPPIGQRYCRRWSVKQSPNQTGED